MACRAMRGARIREAPAAAGGGKPAGEWGARITRRKALTRRKETIANVRLLAEPPAHDVAELENIVVRQPIAYVQALASTFNEAEAVQQPQML
jgi:hypothetical protein